MPEDEAASEVPPVPCDDEPAKAEELDGTADEDTPPPEELPRPEAAEEEDTARLDEGGVPPLAEDVLEEGGVDVLPDAPLVAPGPDEGACDVPAEMDDDGPGPREPEDVIAALLASDDPALPLELPPPVSGTQRPLSQLSPREQSSVALQACRQAPFSATSSSAQRLVQAAPHVHATPTPRTASQRCIGRIVWGPGPHAQPKAPARGGQDRGDPPPEQGAAHADYTCKIMDFLGKPR